MIIFLFELTHTSSAHACSTESEDFVPLPPVLGREEPKGQWDDEDLPEEGVKQNWEDEEKPKPVSDHLATSNHPLQFNVDNQELKKPTVHSLSQICKFQYVWNI